MKFFIDTEFIEAGRFKPLTLISIGIVCKDATLYMVSSEFKEEDCNNWVKQNVLPILEGTERKSIPVIAQIIKEFVNAYSNGEKPEFWGYYCDYDWVVFCQLFGSMIDLPKGWPMYCRDLKQLCDLLGNPKLPKPEKEHNAIEDAIWNMKMYEFLVNKI